MDYGSDDMSSVTVNGNLTNSGTLSLSGSAGGDIDLKGNFVQNGTFHNSRAITMVVLVHRLLVQLAQVLTLAT